MLIATLLALALLVSAALFVALGFNKLRNADINVLEASSGIDVQLTRRADLIPNLVNTVKGYAAHERGVFEEVSTARAGAAAAASQGSIEDKARAAARLDQAVVKVLAVAEAYPELRASTGFLQLQAQLAETESQLSFARQFYNDSVATLNKLVSTVPWLFLSGMASVRTRPFYIAPSAHETVPRVDF